MVRLSYRSVVGFRLRFYNATEQQEFSGVQTEIFSAAERQVCCRMQAEGL
jgi:hypothetical protein